MIYCYIYLIRHNGFYSIWLLSSFTSKNLTFPLTKSSVTVTRTIFDPGVSNIGPNKIDSYKNHDLNNLLNMYLNYVRMFYYR